MSWQSTLNKLETLNLLFSANHAQADAVNYVFHVCPPMLGKLVA